MKIKPISMFLGLAVSFILFKSLPVFANMHTATLVQAIGEVQVFYNPKRKPEGQGPHVLFRRQYYNYRKARVGQRIQPGEAVITGTNGKARLIYPNGDHIAVAPGTGYVLRPRQQQKTAQKEKRSLLQLFYGKLRAVISKEGPRTGMKIKTRAAVAGVRGTDFFVSYHDDEGLGLKVLRGEVIVKARGPAPAKKVKTGYMAVVTSKNKERRQKKRRRAMALDVRPMVRKDILEVQKASYMDPRQVALAKVNPKKEKELEQLKEKAKEVILKDIKQSSSMVVTEPKDSEKKDFNDLNVHVLSDLYKKTTKSKDDKKPSADELKDMGPELYEKYFQPFDN